MRINSILSLCRFQKSYPSDVSLRVLYLSLCFGTALLCLGARARGTSAGAGGGRTAATGKGAGRAACGGI